ncbi:MAG: protein translocase subunit SecD [Candidatus Marinimicrobia bacterium]|nr:protein translocase subunit SecD [Candidatus Neomarinimicrobiota bacterium]TFB08855.1 protein translocase subunit SecD [Candidatus Marinimicrobia bacterium MT.SAG.2]
MGTQLTPRFVLIGAVIVMAIYMLSPTIEYYFFPPDDEEAKEALQEKALKLGLDLQGGMHVVMEVNIPKLVENIASNKTLLYDALAAAETRAENDDIEYLDALLLEANERNIRLARHFIDYGIENSEIISALEDEADDAVNRALEVIRNRVDQFGVSEPTILKQGSNRIIVELAGVQDPERARNLIRQTALLEFSLLKEPDVVQAVITRIDNVLKSIRTGIDLDSLVAIAVSTTDTSDNTLTALAESKDKSISVDEIFGVTTNESNSAGSEGSVIVDEQIFDERPFSALLRNIGGDIGVPAENVKAVRRILALEEVKAALPADMKIIWSNNKRDFGGRGLPSETYNVLYAVNREPGLTGDVVTSASANFGGGASSASGQPVVYLNMNSEGARAWSRLTGANINKRVAIILDDKVHSAPVIRSKIPSGNTIIEGMNSINEAKDLSIILRAGALPAPMEVIEERTIGPTLGRDSIEKGTNAALIGFALVMIFMVLYYRMSGLLANFALLLNLIFVLAIMTTMRATLTLPGIAGLILTIGMSVDANVLIFERIKEELRKGKTVRSAIDAGYSKALTTIIDANVTTILAALVLFQFGTGPIKGFAVTLFWGILASMLTAIFITRTIYAYVTDRFEVTKLSI